MYPRDGRDADELLRNATTAMSYAKTSGSGEVALYKPSLRSQSLERVTLESDLKRAVAAKEFEVHYQPIINVATRRIDAFEALLRWHHPRFGLLEPSSFIDVAEDTGTIEALGTWVLQTACEQGRRWHDAGHDIGISVNVSMRQFRGDVLGIVEGVLASTGFPARQLELELTESLLLTDRPRAQNALGALKRLGVRVAIDDFGTGYSSLAYLRTFPLDALKIDRSFVSDITSKSYDEAIARTIILLGRTLGVRVIAEGVEDVQQAAILHKLGCDAMQGYFFGKPSPANEWLQLLESMA
jgi:EAL domain-containing protein (putative c-di-GMP-specific phosphodiesterase class I)